MRRHTSSVLYAPSALSAMALPYGSPTVPVDGSIPYSITLVVYTVPVYCVPWSELNRHRFNSDMGWQYRHRWWRDRLAGLNIRQSMSRKGNCIDNAATEQVFGHLKDEFYAGREFASYEQFKNELDAYIIHWNTKRRQIRLEGHTPEEFRNMSLTA